MRFTTASSSLPPFPFNFPFFPFSPYLPYYFLLSLSLFSSFYSLIFFLKPSDLAAYMRFHYRKLFSEDFQPEQFCYAVRRPEHYPEGILSIEASTDGT